MIDSAAAGPSHDTPDRPSDSTPEGARGVLLRADGVALVVDVRTDGLPEILYWGGDIGPVDDDQLQGLRAATTRLVMNNQVDVAVRVAVVPEHRTGWTGRPGLSGSRGGRDWSPAFAVRRILADGAVVDPAESLITLGTGVVRFEADDPQAGLGLDIDIELLTGGVVRSRATLTNQGEDPYQLDDLVLTYPVPARARELLDFAGRWAKERTPQRRELGVGTHLREGRHGRTGPDAATLLHLGTPGFGFADGEIWAVHTGWSGDHTHYAERLFTGDQLLGGGELLLPGEIVLDRDASYTSPWVYGSWGFGLDQVAHRFHRWLRSRPQHPDADRPVTLNVWEAVYFDHDLDRLLALAQRAAELGVERYVLDDGWFGSRRDDHSGLGDWQVSVDVWPNGLAPLTDRVLELGMQFGLWFEPEMINLDSDVARAHPEWIMATGDRLPVESRHQQVINLGIPECFDHIRDAMLALLDRYPISYIKWDHNRDLVDAGTAPSGRPGVHDQTAATYRLMDDLKAAHPDLEIESCSSGGARVDLGVLERTDRVWVSDCIDPLERQQMNRWTSQLIPPELMGSHIASGRSHTTGRRHDLSFRAASAVFGHLGIEWDLIEATPEEFTELGQWLSFYKTERRLLLGGDLVRVDHPDQSLALHGVVAPDRDRAIFEFATLSRSEVSDLGSMALPGLDPDRRYRVAGLPVGTMPRMVAPSWWADGVIMTGAALAGVGVRAPALDPEQAVLIRVDAV